MSNLDHLYRNFIMWARFKRLLILLALVTAATIIVVFAIIWWCTGPMPINFMIAVSLGMFLMIMLTALLMGLVFMSSSTGHDDKVIDPTEKSDETS